MVEPTINPQQNVMLGQTQTPAIISQPTGQIIQAPADMTLTQDVNESQQTTPSPAMAVQASVPQMPITEPVISVSNQPTAPISNQQLPMSSQHTPTISVMTPTVSTIPVVTPTTVTSPASLPATQAASPVPVSATPVKKAGFFDKVKQWLGIGGVKIDLQLDPNITWQTTHVAGKIVLTTKSQQTINQAKVKMTDIYKYKIGDSYRTKEYPMGNIEIPGTLVINPGETKAIDFDLPIAFHKSAEDKLKEEGGVLKALGTAGSFLKGSSDQYVLEASVDVVGTALDPVKIMYMKLA